MKKYSQLLIFLLVIVMMAVTACGGSEDAVQETAVPPTSVVQAESTLEEAAEPTAEPEIDPTATSEPELTKAPEAETAVSGDALPAEILAAFDALYGMDAWRANQTIEDADISMTNVIEYQAPDRYRMIMAATEDISMETIIIGDKMYQNLAGTWMENPFELGDQLSGMLSDPREMMEGSFEEFEFIGTEDVNGEPAKVYRFKVVDSSSGETLTTEIMLWVRVSDNLPVKQEMIFPGSDAPDKITQEYEYDIDITIEPPE